MRMRQLLSKLSSLLPKSHPIYSTTSLQSSTSQEFNIAKEDLRLAYLSHPVVNRAIRFRADMIIARGFSLEFSDETTKEIITEFLNDVKLNSPFHADFKTIIRNASIDCDIFGNAFYHLIPNHSGQKIVKLAPLHPLQMDFQRDSMGNILLDDYGEPLGFVFAPGTERERKFKREEVAHLVFETIGDELTGISFILPMFRTLEKLTNIEFSIAQALYKHGLPTRDVSVGDPDHPPTVDDIEKVADQVQNLDAASEYVHPYYLKVSTIQPWFPPNIGNIPEFFLSQIAALSGVPRRFLLGEEKFATSFRWVQRNLAYLIEPLQARIKVWCEEQIFRRVLDLRNCDGKVELIWKPLLEEEESDYINNILKLARATIDGKPLLSWEEARDKLKLPKVPQSPAHVLMTLRSMPSVGLYLVEPHGELIWLGRKKAIVKSVRFRSHIGEPLFLLSGNLCYGVIKLDSPVEIDLNQFKELTPKHLVSEEERQSWWPEKKKLYYYPITIVSLFNPPRKWKFQPGTQNFVLNVEFEK